jgi:hypothetical protein
MKNADFTPHENITGHRSRDNEFSLEAAPSQAAKSALMIDVYQAFVVIGPAGATREAAYVPLGIRTQTGHPICSELIRIGKLIRTGRRGLSRLGRPAEILVADVYAEVPLC